MTGTGVGITLVSQVDSKTGEAKCPKGKANLTLNQLKEVFGDQMWCVEKSLYR